MAEITKEEMQELLANQRTIMEQNKQLASENAGLKELIDKDGLGSSRLLKRITERKVEIRFVDGKAVVGYKNQGTQTSPKYIYSKPDPKDPRQEIDMVDLILEGMEAKDAISVPYSQFCKESARKSCKVVATEEKEWLINQGTVKKREVEEYSSIELDFDVPVDVIGVSRTFTVEVLDENTRETRNVKVGEMYVNIA